MSKSKQNKREEQGENKDEEFYKYFEKEFRWRADRDLPSLPGKSDSEDKIFWRSTSRSN